jgi:hypothetical protein
VAIALLPPDSNSPELVTDAREETSLFMPLPLDDVGQFRLKIYDTLPIFSTGIVCFATTMHTFLTAPQLKIPSKGVQTDFLAARIQMAVDAHGG